MTAAAARTRCISAAAAAARALQAGPARLAS
jgi:hypothetical protein